MKNKKKLIIFDMDGVIIDSMQLIFKNTQKQIAGLTWNNYQVAVHKQTLIDGMKSHISKRIVESPSEQSKRVTSYLDDKECLIPIHEGMLEVLQILKRDYFMTLNTNAKDNTTFPSLKKLGLINYFDIILTADNAQSKAKRSESMMKTLEVSPMNTIFITDATGDVLEAKEVGVRSIGTTWGIHDRMHFEDHDICESMVAIVDTSKELLEAITIHFTNEKR